LSSQLNELRDVVEHLKSEALEKERDLNMATAYATVVQEMAQAQNVQIIANLKLELQQVHSSFDTETR
jgi:signal transduction histidine kinase